MTNRDQQQHQDGKNAGQSRAGEAALRFMVTGGGTGGHLFPGIAVAAEFQERLPDSELIFVGSGRPVDTRVLAGRPFSVATIRCPAMKGTRFFGKLGAMALLPRAFFEAAVVIRRFAPDLVFGVGGYASGPVVLAARLLGRKTCIHEQNSVPGVTNRLLGRIADRVFVSMPGSENYFARTKTVMTGNPVRRELLQAARLAVTPKEPKDQLTLLVLGGSQGAHSLNELVPEAIAASSGMMPAAIQVVHQCGAADVEMVRQAYARFDIKAEIAAFIEDMAGVYRRADLVISRAGATTLAEITLFGLPALLVPYPFAADDHQTKNARVLERVGGARVLPQQTLNIENLAQEITHLAGDATRRREMGARLLTLSRPDAAAAIVDGCLAVLRGAPAGRRRLLTETRSVSGYV